MWPRDPNAPPAGEPWTDGRDDWADFEAPVGVDGDGHIYMCDRVDRPRPTLSEFFKKFRFRWKKSKRDSD